MRVVFPASALKLGHEEFPAGVGFCEHRSSNRILGQSAAVAMKKQRKKGRRISGGKAKQRGWQSVETPAPEQTGILPPHFGIKAKRHVTDQPGGNSAARASGGTQSGQSNIGLTR